MDLRSRRRYGGNVDGNISDNDDEFDDKAALLQQDRIEINDAQQDDGLRINQI